MNVAPSVPLQFFLDFIQNSEGVYLIHFKSLPKEKNSTSTKPFTEILQSEFVGKLHYFEMDLDENISVLKYYKLSHFPTAIIFVEGQTHKKFQGYPNVRKYLRDILLNPVPNL